MSPAKPETVNRAKKMLTGSLVVIVLFVGEAKAGLGAVSRDPCLVDLVDLFGVEEFLGVAQVDLLAHEDVEELRVDVAAFLHAPEDGERLGQGLALLVRP